MISKRIKNNFTKPFVPYKTNSKYVNIAKTIKKAKLKIIAKK